jgi:hypothetical protein
MSSDDDAPSGLTSGTETAETPGQPDVEKYDVDVDVGSDRDGGAGDEESVVELRPPVMSKTRWGMLGKMLSLYQHHKKKRKLAKKGHVQWYLVDSTWPTPKYVNPKDKGGNYLELEHDGGVYLFPREAMLASEREGMWTVVHKKGEALPENYGEPSAGAIKAGALKEYLNQRLAASPPSFFDRIDIDPQEAIMYLIGGIILVAFLQNFLG